MKLYGICSAGYFKKFSTFGYSISCRSDLIHNFKQILKQMLHFRLLVIHCYISCRMEYITKIFPAQIFQQVRSNYFFAVHGRHLCERSKDEYKNRDHSSFISILFISHLVLLFACRYNLKHLEHILYTVFSNIVSSELKYWNRLSKKN